MARDLKPLPERVRWWRETRNRRHHAFKSFKAAGRRALTLAISVLGATLVGYGVWMIYAPAGFIVGGVTLWVLQWNYGTGKGVKGEQAG